MITCDMTFKDNLRTVVGINNDVGYLSISRFLIDLGHGLMGSRLLIKRTNFYTPCSIDVTTDDISIACPAVEAVGLRLEREEELQFCELIVSSYIYTGKSPP